jgi:large subunit ribosomal protein L17
MRHQLTGRKLGRGPAERRAMQRNLMTQLLEHERIRTTEAKAKFVRSDIEKLITLAKDGLKANGEATPAGRAQLVHAHRLAAARLTSPAIVHKLFDAIAPRYTKRLGGYTRILKLGARKGDSAEMVLLELVEE